MVEVQGVPPAITVRKKGSGVMSKSGPLTLTNTLVLFVIEPLDPDTSTKKNPVFVPIGARRVRVAVPGSGTLVGARATVRPGGKDDVAERVTVPVNPPTGLTVIVELFVAPPASNVKNSR
jgi:hypothetical protein